MTDHIIAFFVALAAYVYHEYIDPWSVSSDVYDIWAMYDARIAFDAWEHAVGGVHPDECVCLFCRNRPTLEEAADAEARGWEPSEEEEVADFFDETDREAL